MLVPCAALVALVAGRPAPGEHSAAIALEVTDKLNGCAVGDLDPAHAGNEIVVTSGKGAVLVVRRAGDGWTYELALDAPGEMIQVAAGDALPARAGDEIVAVGMKAGSESDDAPGAVHVIWREGAAWKSVVALETSALAHGVAVGDAGIFVVGFDRKVHLLRAKGEAFERVASADLPGNGKCALAVAGGALIACTDGSLVEAKLAQGKLVTSVLDKRESGRARLGSDGTRILTSDDDGALVLVTPTGRQELYRETQKLRGAVLADLDPSSPGLEAATTGYSGRVTLLRETGGPFVPSLLFADRAGFHHAAAGELDGRPGLELVVCGLAGRVLVFSFGAESGR